MQQELDWAGRYWSAISHCWEPKHLLMSSVHGSVPQPSNLCACMKKGRRMPCFAREKAANATLKIKHVIGSALTCCKVGCFFFLPFFFLLILILPKEPHYWKQQHLWLKLPTCLGNVFQQVPVTNPCAYPMVNVIFYFAKRICCIVKVRMAHCIVEE